MIRRFPDPRPSLLVVLLLASPTRAAAQNLLDFWVPNGEVNALAYDPFYERLYVGGSFDRVGAPSGAGAVVSSGTGEVQAPLLRIGEIGAVAGAVVHAAVPDGSGGWFIGGDFTEVRGLARLNLARVDASGNVLPWNPGATGPVHSMALSGGVLYVGGGFTALGGVARLRLGAFDVATGDLTAWAPSANDVVRFVGVFSGTVYAGGEFTTVNSTGRNRIAAVSTAGALSGWNPNADGAVWAVYRSGSNVALGGDFLNVGGASHQRLALVSATTGAVLPGTPNANARVHCFDADATRLFIGGSFTSIGGLSRTGVAALTIATGMMDATWDADLDGAVRDAQVAGAQLYLAGDFEHAGGTRRAGTAAVSASNAVLQSWDPRTGAPTHCVAVSGATAFVGGEFLVVNFENSQPHYYCNLAAFDFAPGSPTFGRPLPIPMEATIDAIPGGGLVLALHLSGPYLYVGGSFDRVNGVTQRDVARIDITTLATDSWDMSPDPNYWVHGLATNGFGEVAVAGIFPATPDEKVMRISAATGMVSGPVPLALPYAGHPWAVTYGSNHTLYLAGDLTPAGASRWLIGIPHPYTSTDALDAFPPDSIGSGTFQVLRCLETNAASTRLYAGGSFSGYGALQRSNLLEIDLLTGKPTSWAPNPDFPVYGVQGRGNRLYVVGEFEQLAGQPRSGIGAFDMPQGHLSLWNPSLRVTPHVFPWYGIAAASNRVAVGGDFAGANGVFQPYLAVFDDTAPSLAVEGSPAAPRLRPTVTPNPVRDRGAVAFTLERASPVAVDLLDIQGRVVRHLLAESALEPGVHRTALDASGLPAGVYLARVRAGGATAVARWVHVR